MNIYNNKYLFYDCFYVVFIYFILNDLFLFLVELVVWNSFILSKFLVWYYILVSIYSNNDKW